MDALLVDCQAGGLTYEILNGVSEKPFDDAVPLRYLATAHRLALGGHAGALAHFYPSCGGAWQGEDISAAMDAVNAEFGASVVYLGAMFGMRDAAPSRVAFTQIPDFDRRVN